MELWANSETETCPSSIASANNLHASLFLIYQLFESFSQTVCQQSSLSHFHEQFVNKLLSNTNTPFEESETPANSLVLLSFETSATYNTHKTPISTFSQPSPPVTAFIYSEAIEKSNTASYSFSLQSSNHILSSLSSHTESLNSLDSVPNTLVNQVYQVC